MKKIVSLILISLAISSAIAQRHGGNGEVKWLSLAIKGGYGGTLFFNQDVMNDQNVSTNFLSPSYSYGGRFGLTYGDHFGLNVEPLMSGFSQEYSINNGTQPYIKKQKFSSFDLFVSLRYISDYGFYAEIGPQFSTLKTASVENDIEGAFTDENPLNEYKTNFAEKYTNIAAGIGFAAINGDRLQLFVGIRGSYAIGNFEENLDFYVLNDGVYNPGINFTAKTSPFTLKLMLELNYFFAFWGDASCGRGRLMFFQ
jgi:hypothetical protein